MMATATTMTIMSTMRSKSGMTIMTSYLVIKSIEGRIAKEVKMSDS